MALAISDTSPRVQYTATGGQTTFTVPFEFFADGDLTVIKTAASNGADTTLTLTASPSSATQYSVTGAGVSGGGTKTLSAELTQLKFFIDSGAFDAGSVNIHYWA